MMHINRKKGYSLVELVIYASLTAMLIAVITYVVRVLFVANSTVRATKRVESSAMITTDRFLRDIRQATNAEVVTSAPLNSSYFDQLLLTIPQPNSTTKTVRFYLNNEKIMVDENGVVSGPLTLEHVRATSLQFFKMSTSTTQAVKFEFVILGPASTPEVSEKFYGTAVLRGTYR